MKTRPLLLLGVVAAIASASGPVIAATGDDGPVRCINLRGIDNTVVVDDQNILFYMLDGRIYQNRLRHPVARLDQDQPFMYRTTGQQLCRGEIITVMERWGFGYTSGGSGTLGDFIPIDAEDARALQQK